MRYTLITGASMGIGEAFAGEFARRGCNLVLVARSESRLQELAQELREKRGVEVRVCIEDLSDPDSPARIAEFCSRHNLEVDLMVNCAGLSRAGDFHTIAHEKLEEIMMVNMMAMARLTRIFLPAMIERQNGGIINVASVGGLQGVPGLGLYSATKAFVITLSEALHVELKGKGVTVVAVCPGFIDTGFFEKAGHNAANIFLPISGTGVVVKAALKGLEKKRIRVFPTMLDYLLVFSQRFVSRQTVIRLAGFFAAVKDDE